MTNPAAKTGEATLYINKSDSRCGACGRGADPYELSHETGTGWFASGKWHETKGCGVLFTGVASDYSHITAEDVQEMRPDLPWMGAFDPFRAPEARPSHTPENDPLGLYDDSWKRVP